MMWTARPGAGAVAPGGGRQRTDTPPRSRLSARSARDRDKRTLDRGARQSTTETHAAAKNRQCFRLKAEATRQTRLRGLGSRRAPREIATSEQPMRAPGPLDADARGGDVRTRLRCGGVLPPEGGSHETDTPPRSRPSARSARDRDKRTAHASPGPLD